MTTSQAAGAGFDKRRCCMTPDLGRLQGVGVAPDRFGAAQERL
eukprot:CAMPEP_0180537154 /NCGR_PEP_ID=MMETSP1036_2-20121128/65662_1 /TAXON_ID=632150 /ORGANISM="Azadinium spinosum, Strain 3D9" /LENGTH=42 /DNA_ID= /DNA_START= /DNA_END= /DNA_ORIENTATION=